MGHNDLGGNFRTEQQGGEDSAPLQYTSKPIPLLISDILLFFRFFFYLPGIVVPVVPSHKGVDDWDELSLTWANVHDMFLHVILIIVQLAFLGSIPLFLMLPLGWFILYVATVVTLNTAFCYLLNGDPQRPCHSRVRIEYQPEHESEHWIFLNGVAVGRHWLQSNVDRLALTFGRRVKGIHNPTSGIVFDVIECLIQRTFNYATDDIRTCYLAVKEALCNPKYNKVVFILHSQGGIEGSMIVDWLLDELAQDLLQKLEVYTFGNAANHFNNPLRHASGLPKRMKGDREHSKQRNGIVETNSPSKTKNSSKTNGTTKEIDHSYQNGTNGTDKLEMNGTSGPHGSSGQQTTFNPKTIRYIEHYANTGDFVSRWGVLHFNGVSDSSSFPVHHNRYMGRVFKREGSGHQLNQHYLDNMFPLNKSKTGVRALRNGDFMNDDVVLQPEDESSIRRETLETTHHSTQSKIDEANDYSTKEANPLKGLTASGFNGVHEHEDVKKHHKKPTMKVYELSRLWKYRNGSIPSSDTKEDEYYKIVNDALGFAETMYS